MAVMYHQVLLIISIILLTLVGESVYIQKSPATPSSVRQRPAPKRRILTNEDFEPLPPPVSKPTLKPKPVEQPQLDRSAWPHLGLAESCDPDNVSLLHQLIDQIGRYNRTLINEVDHSMMFLWQRSDGDLVVNMQNQTVTFVPKNMTLANVVARYGSDYERKDGRLVWHSYKNRRLTVELSLLDEEKITGIIFSLR